MHSKNIFLSPSEEKSIKQEFHKYYNYDQIDKDISEYLLKLNSICGLATLYSCQGHEETGQRPYLVLKCSEEMYKPLYDALYSLNKVSIEWNESVVYPIFGIETRLEVIIIRSNKNTFFKKLSDILYE